MAQFRNYLPENVDWRGPGSDTYAQYDIRIFAPSHTQVIRNDLPQYLAALKEAMRRAVTADYNNLVY